jgi:hypothetical protein
MSNRLTIVVEGVEDTTLVADIDKTIRESFDAMAYPGPWRVVVKPSHVRGRWDFRVYGLDVRHTLSITVPANLLSSLIPRRLRESLERSGLRAHHGASPLTRAHDSTPALPTHAGFSANAHVRAL